MTQDDASRKAFEEWAEDNFMSICKGPDGAYSLDTALAFKAWQASERRLLEVLVDVEHVARGMARYIYYDNGCDELIGKPSVEDYVESVWKGYALCARLAVAVIKQKLGAV